MSVVIVSPPGLTREQYEESVRRLHPEGPMESPADWPVEGLLAHIVGEGPNGFRVVDVWESMEAVQRFADILIPMNEEIGIQGEPEVYPAEKFITG